MALRIPSPRELLVRSVEVPALLLGALVSAVLLLALLLWSAVRDPDPRFDLVAGGPLHELVDSLAGLTHGAVVPGNDVELLEDARFYEVLLEELRGARRTVHLETFLWEDGALGRRVAQVLAERARAGVTVRVLVDASGSSAMGEGSRELLRTSGCSLADFHPRDLRSLGRLNNRDHRKLVVVDGRVALVGGHCIVDAWSGEDPDIAPVRDLSVRVRGPVVGALQGVFSENWLEQTGEPFVGDGCFPALEPAGDISVHVASLRPRGAPSAVKVLHHVAIALARERLWIQNPYFLPDPEGVELLVAAARRGVDVQVMVPSPEASDMPLVQHASRRTFAPLLAAGVRIFEYQPALLHQKVLVVDSRWSAVGSSNFDDRSFELNDELTLGILDAGLARQLEAIFERDRRQCVERRADEWSRRGPLQRTREALLYLVNEQL